MFFKTSITMINKKINSDEVKKIEKRVKVAAIDGASAVTPEKLSEQCF